MPKGFAAPILRVLRKSLVKKEIEVRVQEVEEERMRELVIEGSANRIGQRLVNDDFFYYRLRVKRISGNAVSSVAFEVNRERSPGLRFAVSFFKPVENCVRCVGNFNRARVESLAGNRQGLNGLFLFLDLRLFLRRILFWLDLRRGIVRKMTASASRTNLAKCDAGHKNRKGKDKN